MFTILAQLSPTTGDPVQIARRGSSIGERESGIKANREASKVGALQTGQPGLDGYIC